MTTIEDLPISKLPYLEKRAICNMLETKECFHEMARFMQFEEASSQEILIHCKKNKTSAIETLINRWNTHGHTILDLFKLLYNMKEFETMQILRPFVDQKYHRYIKKSVINSSVETRDDNVTMPQQNHESKPLPLPGMIPQIPYEELVQCTNNWDPNNMLGKGGFGSVFKGTWKYTQVAVKRIDKKDNNPESINQQMMQSHTELHCLNANRHDNILPLYGFSSGGPEPCLIYQYMPGGSLDSRLHTRDPNQVLDWPARINIAIGSARGIQFLHTIREKPLIHGDIKSANILLDYNDHPRIGDFGLAREGTSQEYIILSKKHGTQPYLPVEFLKDGKFSTKIDTYSFGVVLFELATGSYVKFKTRERKERLLRDYVVGYPEDRILELKDLKLLDDEDENLGNEEFLMLVKVGMACVQSAARDRPEMVEVLKLLDSQCSNN